MSPWSMVMEKYEEYNTFGQFIVRAGYYTAKKGNFKLPTIFRYLKN